MSTTLIESATPVAFGQIEAELARQAAGGTEAAPARALTATVVAVGPPERLQEVVEPLQTLGRSGATRGILIPQGPGEGSGRAGRFERGRAQRPPGQLHRQRRGRVAALEPADGDLVAGRTGRDPWPPDQAGRPRRARRGSAGARLACAVENLERAAFSDVRWTRLTRWRALMAQFFDLPEVQDAPASFTRLCIEASDRAGRVALRRVDAERAAVGRPRDHRDSRQRPAARRSRASR